MSTSVTAGLCTNRIAPEYSPHEKGAVAIEIYQPYNKNRTAEVHRPLHNTPAEDSGGRP